MPSILPSWLRVQAAIKVAQHKNAMQGKTSQHAPKMQ